MNDALRVWIVGMGAIGSVVAGRLRNLEQLVAIDGWWEHVRAIRANGLHVAYPHDVARVSMPAFHLTELELIGTAPDVVLLAVKSNETRAAAEALVRFLRRDSMVVSLQNGVNEEAIAGVIGWKRTVGAAVDFGGELLGPGRARGYSLESGLKIGELDGSCSVRVEALAQVFHPEVPVEITADVWGALWSKLVVNSQVNALSALTGLPTDRLAADPLLRQLAVLAGIETVRVAHHLGLQLDRAFLDADQAVYLGGDIEAAVTQLEIGFVDRWSGESFRPSMLQDVEKGRPTEITAINGFVLEKARRAGMSARIHESLVDLVGRVERGGRENLAADVSRELRVLRSSVK